MKRYFTTAIDYVNSVPHIGTAYEKIGADVLCRFYRLLGDETRLQMGNDEHSANVQKAAEAKNLSPKVYCDEMRPKFEDAWKKLGIHYDDFIQTSEQRHHQAVMMFFDRVIKSGDIYEKDYEGWYCESCEAFYLEKDLEAGLCKNHKSKPKWLKEKNYFFKLSRYSDALLKHIETNPNFILPASRRNEVVSFIKSGLEDFSISRSTFSWGIPVPLNPKHVFYVWFDALINYITGLGFGKTTDDLKGDPWWQNVTHIVGKDITRFHCIIWPAMLLSAGLPLPKMIFGHGFVYLRGEKMSKSLGNVVTPLDVLNKFPDFGADALRYYLMRSSSFGDDGNFTWDDFIVRYNADLANGIGNLASRILGMIFKYQGGKKFKTQTSVVDELLTRPDALIKEVEDLLDPVKSGDICTHLALEKIWGYITNVDGYIDRMAPWQLAKEKKTTELSEVLTTLVEAMRKICFLIYPFIPNAAGKIWQAYRFQVIHKKNLDQLTKVDFSSLISLQFANESPETMFEKSLNLFPRIEMEKKENNAVATALQTGNVPNAGPPQGAAPTNTQQVMHDGCIEIADFSKIDLRVAKILSAEKVEKADKLLLLQVDVGGLPRQIVAGIAQHYKPEDLVGKSVVIVANLKPAKIRGHESFGMLLAAKDDKALFVVSPAGDIGSGARVG